MPAVARTTCASCGFALTLLPGDATPREGQVCMTCLPDAGPGRRTVLRAQADQVVMIRGEEVELVEGETLLCSERYR